MSKKMIFGLLVLLVFGSWQTLAYAKGKVKGKGLKRVRVAILPVQVKGVPAGLGNNTGTTVFKELRQIGVFRFISPRQTGKVVRWLKKKKIFTSNCIEKPKCIRKVGRRLKAKVLYHLIVAKAQGGVTLSMRTFDVKSGKQVRKGSEFAQMEQADINRAVRWLTRTVSGPMITTLAKGKGKLQVNCEESGADLFLNGKSFGKRTGKSFKVSSGVFDIVVKKDGFMPFHDVVVVKPDQKQVVTAVLKRDTGLRPPVVASGTSSGDLGKVKPGTGDKKPKDLPAWAVFEKPKDKPKPLILSDKKDGTTAGGTMPWQQVDKKKPFLPEKEEKPKIADAKENGDTAFYESWWFWTIIGVGVAGAAGTTAYFVLSGGGADSGQGSALVTWD
ncbi:MAG: PEGA domain-containing protein [Deltaproteobacteria bacterium]|nr:PEGA domain-containing protein [Deltaproteobacteria bacterium]